MRTAAVMLPIPLGLLVLSCSIIQSAKLEQAVVSALAEDRRTAGYSFEVSLQDAGQVLITGEVDTAEQVAAVREIAQGVSGVQAVINMVHVEEPGSGLMQDEVVTTPYF
jgi:hypothetical protein